MLSVLILRVSNSSPLSPSSTKSFGLVAGEELASCSCLGLWEGDGLISPHDGMSFKYGVVLLRALYVNLLDSIDAGQYVATIEIGRVAQTRSGNMTCTADCLQHMYTDTVCRYRVLPTACRVLLGRWI